jgi:hypothetical protein
MEIKSPQVTGWIAMIRIRIIASHHACHWDGIPPNCEGVDIRNSQSDKTS